MRPHERPFDYLRTVRRVFTPSATTRALAHPIVLASNPAAPHKVAWMAPHIRNPLTRRIVGGLFTRLGAADERLARRGTRFAKPLKIYFASLTAPEPPANAFERLVEGLAPHFGRDRQAALAFLETLTPAVAGFVAEAGLLAEKYGRAQAVLDARAAASTLPPTQRVLLMQVANATESLNNIVTRLQFFGFHLEAARQPPIRPEANP